MTPHDKSTTSRSWVLRLTAVAAIVASLGFGAATRAHADDNSGTVKLSQDGVIESPSGGSNEPKLCLPFYVQGYSLNPSQSYTLKFFYQGGSANGQLAGTQTTSTDPSGGFNATITSGSLTIGPAPYGAQLSNGGHYKVSVFDGATEVSDTKDKSKVFKVECGNTSETLTSTDATTCAGSSATVDVLLQDKKNTGKDGKLVGIDSASLTYSVAPATTAKLSATGGSTAKDGTASFTVSDSVAERVTVTVSYSYGSGDKKNPTTLTGSDYVDVNFTDCPTSPPGKGGDTPELGSGELLATGLLPIGAILLYRRRRNRRAS